MTRPPLSVEDWGLGVSGFDPVWRDHLESLFAVSNGFLGWRGTIDELPSRGTDTCRLAGFFDCFRQTYAEPAYAYPEWGQTLVGAPDGALIRLSVDGEALDLTRGTVEQHEQYLDLRAGTLRRETVWMSPAGARVRIESTRLASLSERRVAAVRYRVEVLDEAHDVLIDSDLAVAEAAPQNDRGGAGTAALVPVSAAASETGGELVHVTTHSGLAVAAAVGHQCDGARMRVTSQPERVRASVEARLRPGHPLTLVKIVAYAHGDADDTESVAHAARTALDAAATCGWDELLRRQSACLDRFWEHADVEIDGDPRLQQAIRFALFHVFQATVHAEGAPVPAKGLTGAGYSGHSFWDGDSFLVPVLALLSPDSAANALRWRHRTLPLACDRARELGLAGASFPWRTIDGHEASGYWPASTAAFHINADIADAALRYVWATGDREFETGEGFELLTETARLWASLARVDEQGVTHIDGVTGPDEYSALADDNVYTNLMAQQNLAEAGRLAARHPEVAARHGVTPEEAVSWRRLARELAMPFNAELDVHEQSAGFTRQAHWDFESTGADQYPLVQHRPYVQLYRHQIAKQADLVLALVRRHDVFTAAQRARDFAYYEPITVRDSSLSAASQAIIAAEVGQLPLALDYVREVAAVDLDDLHKDTRGGIHLAAAAGLWSALAAGFGGLRLGAGDPSFAPRLPPGIPRLRLRMVLRGQLLLLDIRPGEARYQTPDGPGLEITHHGRRIRVSGEPVSAPIPPLPPVEPRPSQPANRPPGLGSAARWGQADRRSTPRSDTSGSASTL